MSGESSGFHLDVVPPEVTRSGRRRSPSNDRPRSSRRNLALERSRRISTTLSRSTSVARAPPEVTKARLCIQGFFYANQYEGPYAKHMAALIHVGNGMLALGLLTAILTFVVLKDTSGMVGGQVVSVVLLTLGFASSLSTTTVYTRAYNNSEPGVNGRLNLHSKEILYQTSSAISVFVVLIGIVITPLGFSLEREYTIFFYFKVMGLCYIILGLFGFCGITAYSRVNNKPDRSQNRFRPNPPRSRTNSHVPHIRVEPDSGSDLNGSDIAVSELSEVSCVSPGMCDLPVPPPYTELDPHPTYSDTGSMVSGAHSLVTLLQFAYADDNQTQPPPYEEVETSSQCCHHGGDNLDPARRLSPVSFTTLHPQPSVAILEITRTESGLTVPDL